MLEAAFEDVVFAGGRYQVRGAPAKALGLAEIAAMAHGETLAPGLEHGLEGTEFWRPPALVYPFGAHIAVVEVDTETGAVQLLDYVSVDDCGVRISPNLVSGQVHGGLAQGIAQALWEELRYGDDGQLVTGTLMDYAVPRADDLPSFRDAATVTPTRATRSAPRASARRPRSGRRRPPSTPSPTPWAFATSTCPCATRAVGSSPRADAGDRRPGSGPGPVEPAVTGLRGESAPRRAARFEHRDAPLRRAHAAAAEERDGPAIGRPRRHGEILAE
jgi:hypothetical protein